MLQHQAVEQQHHLPWCTWVDACCSSRRLGSSATSMVHLGGSVLQQQAVGQQHHLPWCAWVDACCSSRRLGISATYHGARGWTHAAAAGGWAAARSTMVSLGGCMLQQQAVGQQRHLHGALGWMRAAAAGGWASAPPTMAHLGERVLQQQAVGQQYHLPWCTWVDVCCSSRRLGRCTTCHGALGWMRDAAAGGWAAVPPTMVYLGERVLQQQAVGQQYHKGAGNISDHP